MKIIGLICFLAIAVCGFAQQPAPASSPWSAGAEASWGMGYRFSKVQSSALSGLKTQFDQLEKSSMYSSFGARLQYAFSEPWLCSASLVYASTTLSFDTISSVNVVNAQVHFRSIDLPLGVHRQWTKSKHAWSLGAGLSPGLSLSQKVSYTVEGFSNA